MHKGIPILSATLNEKFESAIIISKNELIKWGKWSKKGKEYLVLTEDEMKLDEIINSYKSLVEDFYAWFSNRQQELHKDDFEQVANIQENIKSWLDGNAN